MVKVYEWQFADGVVFGCGTECEFRFWQSEGVVGPAAVLGKVICSEPVSEDQRRKELWGLGEWHDKVPA